MRAKPKSRKMKFRVQISKRTIYKIKIKNIFQGTYYLTLLISIHRAPIHTLNILASFKYLENNVIICTFKILSYRTDLSHTSKTVSTKWYPHKMRQGKFSSVSSISPQLFSTSVHKLDHR